MKRTAISFSLLASLLLVFSLAPPSMAAVCELPDNGQGTADSPPIAPTVSSAT